MNGFNWRFCRVILKKELMEIFRDRRAWMASVIIPLLVIPVMLYFAYGSVSQVGMESRRQIPVYIDGLPANQQKWFVRDPAYIFEFPENPVESLKKGEIRAIIIFPSKMEERLQIYRQQQIRVIYDGANPKSAAAKDRVEQTLKEWEKQIIERRVEQNHLPVHFHQPFNLQYENVSNPEEETGIYLGFLIPIVMITAMLTGAIPVATDAVAGEKERGNLPVLRSTPVAAVNLIFGKLLAVAAMGSLSGIAAVVSVLWVLSRIKDAAMDTDMEAGILFYNDLHFIILFLLLLILSSLWFAALQLLVSTIAKTLKEAQTYMTPLVILIVIPLYLTLPRVAGEIPDYFFILPVVNITSQYKEWFVGILNWQHMMMTTGSLVLYGIMTMWCTVRIFIKQNK